MVGSRRGSRVNQFRSRALVVAQVGALLAASLAAVTALSLAHPTPAFATNTYSQTVLGSSPVAYWRLGEGSGNFADSTSNGNTASAHATITYGASGAIHGDSNTAVSLDGSSAYAEAPDSSSLDSPSSQITLEAWAKPTSGTLGNGYFRYLIQKAYTSAVSPYYQYGLGIADGGSYPNSVAFSFSVGGGSLALLVANYSGWQYGVWNHLVGTYDGSYMRLYVNGQQVAVQAQTGTIDHYATPLDLGAYTNYAKTSTYLYAGGVDEAAIYPTALTAHQVEADYAYAFAAQGGANTTASPYRTAVLHDGPAAYWRMDDPSPGPYLRDQSANANDAVVSTGGVSFAQTGATATDTDTSMTLDGSAGNVQAPDDATLDPSSKLTLEAWINPTSGQFVDNNFRYVIQKPYTAFISPYYQYGLGIADNSTYPKALTFSVTLGGTNASLTVNNAGWSYGTWNYLVGTYDGAHLTLYVNGVRVGSPAAASGSITNYHTPVSIGAYPDLAKVSSYLLEGGVDEVAIYPGALTPTQVASHYAATGHQVQVASPPSAASVAAPGQPCPKTGGDPVNAEFGSFTESFTDLAIPCRGLGVSLTRTYNTFAASTNGPFGYGWAFDSGASLAVSGSTATWTEENGAQESFTQSGSTWAPTAPQTIATLTHNGDGTWTIVRDARETFSFNSSGQLTSMKDLNGYTTTFGYTSGNLTSETDAASRSISFTWTGSHITSVTDANVSGNTRTVSYQYNDGNGNLTDVIDVNGGHTSFTYDSSHRVTVMKDPVCYVTSGCPGVQNHYNASGQVDWQKDQLNRQTTFSYTGTPTTAAGGSTTVTDPKGNVTVDAYQWGVLTAETRGSGTAAAATTRYGYDPNTLMPILVVDPNGNETYSTYDTSGNVLTRTDALGRTTTSTYNSLNEPLTVQDARGVTTTFTYDANGNLLTRSTPVCSSPPCTGSPPTQQVTYTYGDSTHPGDVTSMTDPDSKVWSYGYDAYGDRVETKDPLGNVSAQVFNADGWLSATYTPKAGCTWGSAPPAGCSSTYETTYGYTIPGGSTIDEFGDVQTVTDPLGHATTYGYDADRHKTSVKDGDGNTTTSVYDLANELTQTERADSPQTTLTTDYNADGTVADQKDGKGNAVLSYGYDALARVTTVTDALSHVTTSTYDGTGNRLTQTDPGGSCTGTVSGCTTFTYDADNEPLSITYSDGTTPGVSGVTYDADGHRTAMTDGTGTSSWTYDSLGRLTSSTNGNSAEVQWAYDLRNLPTTVTYPGGHAVTDGYDDAGRMTSVEDWLGTPNTTTFGYDADSNLTTETFPSGSGLVDTFGFNAADQMTSVSDVTGGTTLFSATYTRDANGQLASDTSVPSASGSFKYSPLNQLCYAGSSSSSACASPPSGATAYGFDAADNLTTTGGATQAFNAADELCWTVSGTSSNACSSAPTGATTYAYDTRGNQTGHVPSTGSATCDAYDQADRLTTITTGTGSSCSSPTTVGTYAYNGDGLRMKKVVGSTTTTFTWDASGSIPLVVQETAGSNTTSYLYGPGGLPVEQLSPSGAPLFYSHDQLGSTRLVTNASGTTQATYTFDPYGNLTASTNPGSITNPLRYGGQYTDAESGLVYLRARYYDPGTGQFITGDPAVASTLSPYGYVGGAPVNGSDPSGLCFPVCWQGGANLAGGVLNTVTLGHAKAILGALGQGGKVNDCSGAFKAGEVAGMVPGLFDGGDEALAADTALSVAEEEATAIPAEAESTLQAIDQGEWPPPGTKGGGGFANDGRGGGEVLPQTSTDGSQITYREWDVNPAGSGGRDGVRIVTGSDGSAYYTSNHYQTFTRMR